MKQCPKCKRWTLGYDEYFGRFRCSDSDCGWMPMSTGERQLYLLRERKEPKQLSIKSVPDLDLEIIPSYDELNDAFSIDFGVDEPTIDLPEPDGRMIWKIGSLSDTVTGFTIAGMKEFGVSEINIAVSARKCLIESSIRGTPNAVASGCPTKMLIDKIFVTARSRVPLEVKCQQLDDALLLAFEEYNKVFAVK
jgi:hypothetical protein